MYDLAVIGAGWAGFNAAIKASELGLKVCLIDKGKLGGTCLNSGCIPTKTLIHSAKVYSLAKKSSLFGIEIQEPKLNFAKIQERKNKIIEQLRSGMQFTLKNVDFINTEARVAGPNEVDCSGKIIPVKSILIATGSKPTQLPDFKFDGEKILSSDDILNLKDIPDSLLIIGGGVIGCEFASLFSILGSRVTLAEKMPQLLPGEDAEFAKKISNIFKKKGIQVLTACDAKSLRLSDYSLALVSVGRSANTQNLGLDKLGVGLEKEKIKVDDYLRTNIEGIFAAGDCTGKTMLAHFAAYQGEIAAHNAANPGNLKAADNRFIPNCIFTDPEIASIGLSEEKAKTQGIETETHKFDFQGSGMARISEETDGFVKIITDKRTDEIIGSSIIGPRATELIAVLSLAVTAHIKASQLKDTIFAHPTFSEAIGETLK
ncbi:MAG TPA: dihydrolipoyl dehydrogenase [Candidatus Margulisiibacteriota bacterium]|nr:dihydrolipoyl dehydrogenase [Candidatus Margulisiibacteriota bacterium]